MVISRSWAGLSLIGLSATISIPAVAQTPDPVIATRSAPILTVNGKRFRDLNRNGQLDRYEDWRLTPAVRADDLLAKMEPAEKAGQMAMAIIFPNAPFGQRATGYSMDMAGMLIGQRHITGLSSPLVLPAGELAAANNDLQELAERQRLGIPVTLSTDPRHQMHETVGASVSGGDFSRWPEMIGFGAIADPKLVERFADVVRQDYRATGFTLAQSPQADLATEPRWPRIDGTFGEDPATVAPLVGAYIRGIQGGKRGLSGSGVAAIVKHWVGYGAAGKGGFDAHNHYGQFGSLHADRLAQHIKPFEAAFAAGVSGVMPAYSIFPELKLEGRMAEQVGVGFNRALVADMLRTRYQFDGIIVSDFSITNDCGDVCRKGVPAGQRPGFDGISMAWGVENLDRVARIAKAINAGIDEIGGFNEPQLIVDAKAKGLIRDEQIDAAARRILIQKFELGLFEHPFVDPAAAARIAARPEVHRLARETQGRAMVVLQRSGIANLLPGARVFLHGVDAAAAKAAGLVVVARPEDATVAIVRLNAPFERLHANYFFGSNQHEGSLAFPQAELNTVRVIAAKVPTIIDVFLDRPAILTQLKPLAKVLITDFGASDDALMDVLTGKVRPAGRLPFELPSSMAAVERQRGDTPADSANPLYRIHTPSLR